MNKNSCNNKPASNSEYSGRGGGSNSCAFNCLNGYSGTSCEIRPLATSCGVDRYVPSGGGRSCAAVGDGWYSADRSTGRTACTKPANNWASWTSSGGGGDNCTFTCNLGYAPHNGNCEAIPTVAINSGSSGIKDIYANNASRFVVSGTCSEVGGTVTVTVGGRPPATQPSCQSQSGNETWTVTMDASHVGVHGAFDSTVPVTASHTASWGRIANANHDVTNHFKCPENFVPVPTPPSSLDDPSFCVAKYEMKKANDDDADPLCRIQSGRGTLYEYR